MKSRKKNNFFTLFEILLVIVLITCIGGALTFSWPYLLKSGNFDKSVERIESKLILAQELALDYKTDVYVYLKKGDKGGMHCTLHPTKTLPPPLAKALNRDSFLPEIAEVSPTALVFEADGNSYSGTICIEGKRKILLTLKGFPTKPLKGTYEIQKPSTPYPEEFFSPT